jgi:hypothetical protein
MFSLPTRHSVNWPRLVRNNLVTGTLSVDSNLWRQDETPYPGIGANL